MGYKKDSIRKGGRWFSLGAIHPLVPSNKFPFSCLIARLALFSSALTLHLWLSQSASGYFKGYPDLPSDVDSIQVAFNSMFANGLNWDLSFS